MATNADFDALVGRITVATNQLEVDVATISVGTTNISESVAQAEQAALDAQSYATQAQDEVEQLLTLKPIFKGEYGEPVNFTTNPTLTTAQDFEDSYGKLYKLKIGATGVVLNGLPDALIDGWHLYVFNATGADITVSGTQTIGGSFLIGDGHIARINRDVDNAFYVYDITSAAPAGGVFRETTLIEAASAAASQQPVALDTPLQLEFGAAQGTVADPVMISAAGAVTFNRAGQYIFNYTSQYGRTPGVGVARLFTRVKVNGVVVGRSRFAKLDSIGLIVPYSTRYKFDANIGDVVTFELIRDSSGVNDGGFFRGVPTSAGTNPAPCVVLEIARLEGTIDSNEGVSTFVELLDTPAAYTGQAGKVVVVKGDETGLEFVEVSGAVDSVNGQTGVVVLDAADVGAKDASYVPDWTEITNKPLTFAPPAHVHSASDVTSGTFDAARIPNLDASKVTTGSFDAARIPSLDASKISTGVVAPARLGTGTPTSDTVLKGDGTWGSAPAPTTGYPLGTTITYDGASYTTYPFANPNQALRLSKLTVGSATGSALFHSTSNLNNVPAMTISFGSADFPSGNALNGQIGFIHIERGEVAGGNTQSRAWAVVQAIGGDTIGKMYICQATGTTGGNWIRVGDGV